MADKIQDNEIIPSGYLLYCSDRHSRGGGAMIFISSKIPSRLIQSYSSIDIVFIELLSSNLIVSCLNIPPGCPFQHFAKVVQSIEALSSLN